MELRHPGFMWPHERTVTSPAAPLSGACKRASALGAATGPPNVHSYADTLLPGLSHDSGWAACTGAALSEGVVNAPPGLHTCLRCAIWWVLTRHAAAQLGQRCAQADLAKLQAQLQAVTEPLFDYDKQYICEFMGWGQPAAAAQ